MCCVDDINVLLNLLHTSVKVALVRGICAEPRFEVELIVRHQA